MTKKSRTILFIICLIFFLVVAPSVILYSSGYRFSFETKKITQTGGLFLKVVPPGAEVFINGKLKDETSLFFGSLLVENLKPGTYDIRVEKERYHTWQKSLEIKENRVTEVKNIVLVPKTPEFRLIAENIENFWFSPDNKKIIFQTQVSNQKEKSWKLELFDKEKENRQFILSEKQLAKTSASSPQQDIGLLSLKWSPNGKKILLETKYRQEKIGYFIIELDKDSPVLTSLDFLGENIKEISFDPTDSQVIFFMVSIQQSDEENEKASKNILFKVDYSQKEIPKLILGPTFLDQKGQLSNQTLITYLIWGENIIWLADSGFLYKSQIKSGEILEVFNLKPHPIDKEAVYEIITSGPAKTFLKENDILYFLDPLSREFKRIADSVHSLHLAPDFRKIAYCTDFEIWLLFLETLHEQPQRRIEEKVFLGRWTEKINQCLWWTSHYLIFTSGNKIKIVESDDRDKINIVDLEKFSTPKIFWDQVDKNLYILTNKSLVVTKGLIP